MGPPHTRRRILLVEADAALSRVIVRHLGRQHKIVAVARIDAALRLLDRGASFDAVFCARRVATATAGRLFDVMHLRWPRVRRIVYSDGADVRGRAERLADAIVDASASFGVLLDALDGG